jgi:thioredoxin-like negative regulator of GroEL
MKSTCLLVLIQLLTFSALAQSTGFKRIDSLISAADYPAAINAVKQSAANAGTETSVRLANKLAEIYMMEGRLNEAGEILNPSRGNQNPSWISVPQQGPQ